MMMDINNYTQQISTPISADNPIGERLSDNELFDFVEAEMMKVGSLSHASVQWQEVEQATLTLLREYSKDIKLLVYLLQCLHCNVTPTKLLVSIEVMSTFINLYWEESFPAPGDRGKNLRSKFLKQMLSRFEAVINKFEFNQLAADEREPLYSAIDIWHRVIASHTTDLELADSIVMRINNELKRLADSEQVENSSSIANPAPQPLTTQNTDSVVEVDSSSDKSTKQSLLQVAEYLGEQEFGTELSIRTRRFAVWGSIYSPPDHKHDGETMLRGMQIERVKDYQDQMHHPSVELWQRVEQSLTLAPFWFDGQLMSYQIAKSLGKENWCRVIAEETQTFIQRMPSLFELKFKGGEPFVSDQVKQWLSEASPGNLSRGGAVGHNWQTKRQEVLQLAAEEGVSAALEMLNQGLDGAVEKREQCYWRLLIADLLHRNHLVAMAQEQYQTLFDQITKLSVPDWEPSLMEQLQRNTKSE